MTRLLTWRSAVRSDRKALGNCICTEPAKARWNGYNRVHPKPWELEVQSGIRDLRPPAGPDTVLLLGEDEQGLAAVVLFSDVEGMPSDVVLRAIAVATRLRGGDGAHAAEALAVALETMIIRARAAEAHGLFVVGRIHRHNGPSKRLCSGAGFDYVRMQDDNLELWASTYSC